MLYPRVRVFGLVFNILPVRIGALWVLGLWASVQVYHALAGDEPSTAWWAHVGGFGAGIILVSLLKTRPAAVPAAQR